MSLPAFFMALAAVTATLAFVALWQSLRAAFGAGPVGDGGLGSAAGHRAALLDEKAALLRSIKDLALERDVGKVSEEDFQELDREYRLRAKEVLRQLDERVGPHLEAAEKDVARAMAEAAESAPADEEAPQACPACGIVNDPDARFCKGCAAPLGDGAKGEDVAADAEGTDR
ncbi:MAG: hypothetical protein ACFCGT_13100 [Sandaracinaceae bacterium]